MHRIDGPGATVDNRFTDGDPVGGVQATMVTDDWANDVQEELMSILVAGGVAPVKGTQDQVLKALTGLVRVQSLTAVTTAGTAPAFTITPSPPITAYAANQRFRVKFNAAAPTSGTLNVSGQGPKNLKQYDSTGAKVATVIAAGQLTDVEYDGTDMVVLDPLPAAAGNLIGIQGSAKNLIGSASGLNSSVAYTADEIVVESAANTYQVLRAVNISAAFASGNGANGIDVGSANSQTASTWYSVWVIWNGTTTAGLLSLSATTPTLPSGYTHKARVGWVRTDGTANKYPLSFKQFGRRVQYVVAASSNVPAPPVLATGVMSRWTSISTVNFVPSTAARITGTIGNPGNFEVSVVPNGAWVGAMASVYQANGQGSFTSQFDMGLESSNIFGYVQAAGGIISCTGWEDTL